MDPHLERLQSEIASVTRDLNAAELTLHAEGKWSAAEILEHLYLTYTSTTKGFQRCLEAGQPQGTTSTWKQRIGVAVTIGAGHMPRGRKSPPHAMPRGLAVENVLAEIAPQITAMDEAIALCEQRYGQNAKLLNHPVLGALTGKQWRKFHYVHGRHHLDQIKLAQMRRRESSVET